MPELSTLALAAAGEDRKRIVLAVLTDVLRRSAGSDLFLEELVASQSGGEGTTVAAAVAIRTAADSASLVAIGTQPGLAADDEAAAFGQLLGELHRRLAEAGVTFVQAMREPEVEQRALGACGYERLATLDYLVASARIAEKAPLAEPACASETASGRTGDGLLRAIPFQRYFRGSEALKGLAALVDATYAGSLDCPQMERFRSAAAMLDTYRSSPEHDPADWLVLVDDRGHALGCLLTTPHLAAGTLEITYMGLVPEARGLGHAAATLEWAWGAAERHGVPQLTLAVDRANRPAVKLYQRHGFELLMSETVWGRELKSESELAAGGEAGTQGNVKV